MTEVFLKSDIDKTPSWNEAAFRMLFWALANVESQDVRKLLIEAIALLASDD
jgi:hypothetical protein